MIKQTICTYFFKALKISFVIFILIITLYPFLNIIAVSFSENIYIMKNEVTILPKGFNLDSYMLVLKDKRISQAYINTIIYVTTGTALSLFVTACGAYAISKKKMFLRKPFTLMIIFTMFFNGGMIPTYLVVRNLGLIDTLWGVILPRAITVWNLIILRTFFLNIPKELEESGTIDGLKDIGVFWYIVLPLSKAALATIGLFYAVAIWNSFFTPFLYLTSPERFPLQIILREIVIAGDFKTAESQGITGDTMIMPECLKFATIMVSTLPILMVYPFIQKYFVKGVMLGSLKG